MPFKIEGFSVVKLRLFKDLQEPWCLDLNPEERKMEMLEEIKTSNYCLGHFKHLAFSVAAGS